MMNVIVEVEKAKNQIDFSVKVMRHNRAPQRFENKPVIDCLIACGCSVEEIKNCIIQGDK